MVNQQQNQKGVKKVPNLVGFMMFFFEPSDYHPNIAPWHSPSQAPHAVLLPRKRKRSAAAKATIGKATWLQHTETPKKWAFNRWVFPKIGGKPPQIIHLFIGCSIIFTIHFGGFYPYFWKHPDCSHGRNNRVSVDFFVTGNIWITERTYLFSLQILWKLKSLTKIQAWRILNAHGGTKNLNEGRVRKTSWVINYPVSNIQYQLEKDLCMSIFMVLSQFYQLLCG